MKELPRKRGAWMGYKTYYPFMPFQYKVHLVLAKGRYVKSNTKWKRIRVSLQFKVFLCQNLIKYKVFFPVLGSVYFPIQGGDILQFKVVLVLSFCCTTTCANPRSWVASNTIRWQYIPIQGRPCIGFCGTTSHPNTRWQCSAIQGWPCFGL